MKTIERKIAENKILVWSSTTHMSVQDASKYELTIDQSWYLVTEVGDADSMVQLTVMSAPDHTTTLIRCDWYSGAWDLILCRDTEDLMDFLSRHSVLAKTKAQEPIEKIQPQSKLEVLCERVLRDIDGDRGVIASGYRGAIRAVYEATYPQSKASDVGLLRRIWRLLW
jgi:hypothetical protein